MALAELKSSSLLPSLEPARGTAGTNSAATSAVTQPLWWPLLKHVTYLHTLPQLLELLKLTDGSCYPYWKCQGTGAWSQSLFSKTEEENTTPPSAFQPPVSVSN